MSKVKDVEGVRDVRNASQGIVLWEGRDAIAPQLERRLRVRSPAAGLAQWSYWLMTALCCLRPTTSRCVAPLRSKGYRAGTVTDRCAGCYGSGAILLATSRWFKSKSLMT